MSDQLYDQRKLMTGVAVMMLGVGAAMAILGFTVGQYAAGASPSPFIPLSAALGSILVVAGGLIAGNAKVKPPR